MSSSPADAEMTEENEHEEAAAAQEPASPSDVEEEKEEENQKDDIEEQQVEMNKEADGSEEEGENAEVKEDDGNDENVEKEDGEEDKQKSKATVENSDDEEFAGFGDEEINANKATTVAKKRAILSSSEDEGGDENDAETAEKGDDGEEEEEKENKEEVNDGDDGVVEGINKKKKKHKKEHHRHHHHRKSSSSSKHHHHKKKTSDDGENNDEQDVDVDEIASAQPHVEGEDDVVAADENEDAAANKKKDDDETSSDDTSVNDDSVKKRKKEMTDLEMVLNKQKEENRRKNRRKKIDSEELNDMDNVISNFISEMKHVANEDRVANEKSQTALQKLKMLPDVINLLHKSDYHSSMLDMGILGAMAEWLAPLPDRSLPNIKIREAFIDALKDFGEISADYLKSSGIGKAVMFLYKHSKETKPNKLKLEKLIHAWSRPIFNLDANFKQLTKEERMSRDLEHVKSSRRNSSEGNANQSVDDQLNASDKFKSSRSSKSAAAAAAASNDEASENSDNDQFNRPLRPGDPGFCPRARVPMPSVKDYINRPRSSVDAVEMSEKKVKKAVSRLEKHKRRFTEIKRVSKFQRAVNMSVSGKF